MLQDVQTLSTFVYALAAGVFLLALARGMGVPAIVLLLPGGILLGPFGLGVVRPESLGAGLKTIVACSVAVILFEGGLTLDLRGYRAASRVIQRLLSVGVLVTWFATAGLIWLLFRPGVALSLLAGSLVIVTGPTVIAPLIKRIRLAHRVHHILHWEGVLIDAVGVFIAVLCFEWMSPEIGGRAAFVQLGGRVAAGLIIGLAGGVLGDFLLRRDWIPADTVNLAVLALALLVFTACEQILAESGLLGVVIAGFTLAVRAPARLRVIRAFKAQLTDLFIGLLFILLAANLNILDFVRHGWRLPAAVAGVMLLVRPLNILASSLGSGLTVREKIFLSWVAPRGIVAASMASLFALILRGSGVAGADLLETFTYSVIATTVLLQGFSAGFVARLLGLQRPEPRGWLLVGANPFARRIAQFIRGAAKVHVTLVDTNQRLVLEASNLGLDAIRADALSPQLAETLEEREVGHVLALTDNEDLNTRVCERWARTLEPGRVHRWASAAAAKQDDDPELGAAVWVTLPKPSVLSAELTAGHARLGVRSAPVPARPGQTLLAVCVGERVHLGKAPPLPEGTEAWHLYLWRESDHLARAVRPELVIRTEARDLGEVMRALVGRAVEVEPKIPREEVLEELVERGAARGSAIGRGIAVPHVHCRPLRQRLCAIAQVPEGVEMPVPDDRPVRLILLLLNPSGDPEGHLAALADIARLVSDEERAAALVEAEGPEAVVKIIREATRPLEE